MGEKDIGRRERNTRKGRNGNREAVGERNIGRRERKIGKERNGNRKEREGKGRRKGKD